MQIIRSFSLFDCFCFVSHLFCSFCICVYVDSRAENVGETQFFLVGSSTVYSNETFYAPLPARKKTPSLLHYWRNYFDINRYKKNQKRGENKTNTIKLSYLHLTTLNLLKLFVGNGRQHFSLRDIMT